MDSNVIAVVAGRELTWEDFEEFLQNVPQEQKAYLSNPNAKEFFVQQMIALHLFAQLGEDEKMDETEEFEAVMKKARRDILSQMAMQKMLAAVTVTEEEQMAYYEAHKQSFGKAAFVQAKHILVDSEEQCQSILEEIQSGSKSFEDAASEYSTCPSGQRGGDLGQFGRGQMVKEFENAAFEGGIGVIQGPVKTQFGYHLILVEDRSEEKISEYAEVAQQVEMAVLNQKRQAAYDAKVKELKEKYCE